MSAHASPVRQESSQENNAGPSLLEGQNDIHDQLEALANSSRELRTGRAPPSFFVLPAEIRQMVYQFFFNKPVLIMNRRAGKLHRFCGFGGRIAPGHFGSLLATCRHIYEEASIALYMHAELVFLDARLLRKLISKRSFCLGRWSKIPSHIRIAPA